MATLLSNNQVKLNDGTIKATKQGEWYDSQHFFNGSLGAVGVVNDPSAVGYGNRVSNEVASQTNPNNVSYIDSQVKATQLQAPVNVPYTTNSSSSYVSGLSASVEAARKALDTNLATRQQNNDVQMAQVKQKEQQTVDKIGELSTPFRADLETQQRESLYVNKNFEDNQKLVDELDQLLTEGNNLIKEQQGVTGIAAIRNPRIQQTMNDVAARAGVIQAVMAARNSQISVAENLIDRSVNAITQDRNDQINYYNTILQLNNQDKLTLTEENKLIALQQVALLQGDLEQAQETSLIVKKLMLDPASAQLMADSGVTLNDSVEVITQKMAQGTYLQEVRGITNSYAADGGTPILDPSTVPAKQLKQYTDSRGAVHYFKMPVTPKTPENDAAGFNLNDAGTAPDAVTPAPKTNQITQISPQTYSTLFNITYDVGLGGQSSSAKLK